MSREANRRTGGTAVTATPGDRAAERRVDGCGATAPTFGSLVYASTPIPLCRAWPRLGLVLGQAGLLLLPQPVAVPLEVHGRGELEDPVEDGRGQDLVVDDFAPVHEALLAHDDQAACPCIIYAKASKPNHPHISYGRPACEYPSR